MMKGKLVIKPIFITTLFLLPVSALAQPTPDLSYFDTFFEDLLDLFNLLIAVSIALALLFFVWGLALLILNAGDEEKRARGKKIMLWGVIALSVMISIWGIVEVLQITFLGETTPPPFP
jgi:uncharacterized protein YhhL (DUF1145 family)